MNKSIALIDHGVGNLRSVQKALESVGATVNLTDNPEEILAAQKVVLPGVGAFADVMGGLKSRELVDVTIQVAEQGTPLLGICVGMQIFFEAGEEFGIHEGLGFMKGRVKLFPPSPVGANGNSPSGGISAALSNTSLAASTTIKVPQTGWNQIDIEQDSPLLHDLPADRYAYFNHSFYCDAQDAADVIGSTDYGIRYASCVSRDNLYGVQFHPEKSQHVGLKILQNFVERCS
jgi:glutamine amidotransferase